MTELINPYRLADAVAVAAGRRWKTTALFAESSSSMFFSTYALSELTDAPHPYARSSMHFGAMGHALGGAVGFCSATRQRAIVLTGDGSLHLLNPLPTAVKHRHRIAIVVLNDSRLSLPFHGSGSIGAKGAQSTTPLPEWDFTRQGSDLIGGRRIARDSDVEGALDEALAHDGCFVVDARVDLDIVPPIGARIASANETLGGNS